MTTEEKLQYWRDQILKWPERIIRVENLILKFSSIPDEHWCRSFTNPLKSKRTDAIGHCSQNEYFDLWELFSYEGLPPHQRHQ